MRLGFIVTGVLAILIAGLFVFMSPRLLIQIASGSVSQNVCTKTFASGISPQEVYAQDIRPEPGIGLIDWALHFDVDRSRQEVRTTVFGAFASRSVFRDGFGCVLRHDGDAPLQAVTVEAAAEVPALLSEISGPDLVAAINPGVKAAVDSAFVEPASGPRRWTQAVVVVHDGRVIGERYAPGYGVDTPLLSHSIAKSVVNALVGILAREGKISIAGAAPLSGWQSDGDAGDKATVDHLLRMSSGLPLDEGKGPGLAQRMWFVEADTTKFAASTPLTAQPGTRWAYSNLGYALLSRTVRKAITGDERAIAVFAQRELFAPLGMRHAFMEFDAAGTPAGSNAMLATAREWAKFGQLYLNDGVVGGRRILPEGWVAYSRKPTLDTGYGAGFWLNSATTLNPWGRPWGLPGAPSEAYFARGYLGQYIVIVPSEHLVVVRFGSSHAPGGDPEGVGALVHDVIAALH